MLYASDFRRIAREALNNLWGVAVGTGLIASILGVGSGGSFSQSSIRNDQDIQGFQDIYNSPLRNLFIMIFAGAIFYVIIWVLIEFFLGGVIHLGYARFNKNVIARTNPQFSDLFSRFDIFWKGFAMQFLIGLYTFLWLLLFIIPGIIASYSYAMTPYILEENPYMTVNEAIGHSKEMMRGNKWKLFCLQISFIGWFILCLFTCGIGFLWLMPYYYASEAAFYFELSGKFRPQETAWDNQNQINSWR